MERKKAFTLIELLVVIAVISLLMGILVPVLGQARERAKILVVTAELRNIAMALESYGMENSGKFPPTRTDCSVLEHAYALPLELVDSHYLTGAKLGDYVRFAKFEDRYNRGYTYKYIAVGKKYDYFGTPYKQSLMIPKGFPNYREEQLVKHSDAATSPVTWAVFSLGPKYDKEDGTLGQRVYNGCPVAKKFWYSAKTRKGIITVIRTKKGQFINSSETN